MQNMNQTGTIVPMTVPSGGVVGGACYLINQVVVVAAQTVAYVSGVTTMFEALIDGVVTLPKASALAIAEGAICYWDNTNKCITTTATGNTKCGASINGGALAAATTVQVRLYFQSQ